MDRSIYIRGGRLVDPVSGRDETGDIFVREGLIAAKPEVLPDDTQIVDAAGKIVAPGFIDIHVHFREPGGEAAETIETGSAAAARGGFTTVVTMPNTTPPIDTASLVASARARGDEVALTHVAPSACISKGREGKLLADLEALASAGAVAFTDDGCTVQSDQLMLEAMEVAADLGIPIMDHAQDRAAELRGGVMHKGNASKRLGLPGIPASAEISIIARDIELAEKTSCELHIQHVSAGESVELIRKARERGVDVTGELTPHHLVFTDEDVLIDDPSRFKMNPPLRSQADREKLIEAVIDGTFCAFATDHAPHTAAAKAKGFREAPFGVVGLETAVGVTYTELVLGKLMDLQTWIKRWTVGPAAVIGMDLPSLAVGSIANIVVLDLEGEWTVDPARFKSLSRNSSFTGRTLTGRAMCSVCRGIMTWTEHPIPLTDSRVK
ncbi:MAG: dihydroorotase [Verrucomicrobia bacterium]|nr:dihydroorotase [Verrucomicrobiota bacterium]